MIYNRTLIAAMLLMLTFAAPVGAHKKHHPEPAQAGSTHPAEHRTIDPSIPVAVTPAPMPQAGGMEPMIHDDEDRSNMPMPERMLNWFGRLHVSIIHFPLAFFPAALFTALIGRRRQGFGKPVQFLIIAGGVTAPIAALLGWLDGGMILSDTDPLLHVHRWLGTLIGGGGLALAIWAWKRPGADRSPGMIAALSLITAALVIQGWYGGAMVHGIDHMNW